MLSATRRVCDTLPDLYEIHCLLGLGPPTENYLIWIYVRYQIPLKNSLSDKVSELLKSFCSLRENHLGSD